MNKVFLCGRLTRDMELKTSAGGTTFARTSIAVDRPFKKEETDFFNLVAFNKTAEFMGKWFEKGSRVLIEGNLRMSNYEDKDGNKRSAIDVVVEQVEFADSKRKAQNQNGDDYPPIDDF